MTRICVVTAGHLCSCPRMVKAADALAAAGYDVRTISTSSTGPSAATDARLHASRRWRWRTVTYDRAAAPLTWLRTGARRKLAWHRAGRGVHTASVATAAHALGRVHDELVRAIMEERPGLIYAGTIGALAAAAVAARRMQVPFALDFEDFHAGERESRGDGPRFNTLARTLMVDAAHGAVFVTAGSAAIAAACRATLDIDTVPIHNVFPLPTAPPDPRPLGSALRLYWFSQSIGPRRGLEDVIRAAGLLDSPVELTLRGQVIAGYVDSLTRLAAATARRVRIEVLPLVSPDDLVDSCRAFDVGIAAEPGFSENSALALSNKSTTYILAGLPVAMTDTPGQRPLANDLGDGAIVFAPGDAATLAAGLQRLLDHRPALAAAREASWQAATRRWHWEHADERGTLLRLVAAGAA